MQDSKQSIFSTAKHFFSGTLLSRMSGALRDVFMAYAFGATTLVAAFMVAFRFAHLLRRVLGEGAMQSALIPQIEKIRLEDEAKINHFYKDLIATLTFILLIIISTISLILIYLLYGVDLTPANQEIIYLTLLMMPSLLFICLFGINAAFLQCQKKYFIVGIAPVAFNLTWILGIIFLQSYPQSQAMIGLALFVNLSCFLQWFITMPSLKKALGNIDFSKWQFFTKEIKQLVTPLLLSLIGVGSSQINSALDAVFARIADLQGPAYLWYAIRLQQLPLALFGIAVASATLPPLTRAIKAKNSQDYTVFLKYAVQKTYLFMIPLTICLMVGAKWFIQILYGHGHFDLEAINETYYCLLGYSIGLLPMTLVLVLNTAFYADHDYKTPVKASLFSIFVNIVLNMAFVSYFNLGAASIALATSIASWVNFFYLNSLLKLKNKTSEIIIINN